ncbi:MAG: hypothetical protein HPY61_02750 [Methanotrichaceae archaeon]|nr:hypothetical protein [Methanotrichaceae archaeon]
MIFPEEYKFVGVKDRERRGDPIYFSTQYLLSMEGPELYRVTSRGQGFMREVEELELLSSGSKIARYPQTVDIRNRTLLIDLAYELCQKTGADTVIFQGPDEHITFVHQPDPGQILNIEVLDVAPPDPPWLVYSLNKLEKCGVLGDLAVRFRPRILDLRTIRGEDVYYPCRASGLGQSLDSDPVVHDHPRIVGCEISREIFLAGYRGKAHSFFNICPLSSFSPGGPFITRCCQSERRGLTRRNGFLGMVVHWGDGPWAIAEAARCLAKELRK